MARPPKHSDEALLAIAREVFLEEGHTASLRAIAERAGMSQPALSARFGSKQALMLRALNPTQRIPWAAALAEGPGPEPLLDQLRVKAREACEFFVGFLPAMAVLQAAGHSPLDVVTGQPDPPHIWVLGQVVGWFERAIAQGRLRDVDPTTLAGVWLASLQAPALLAHAQRVALPVEVAHRHADAVTALLWQGIAPSTEEEEP